MKKLLFIILLFITSFVYSQEQVIKSNFRVEGKIIGEDTVFSKILQTDNGIIIKEQPFTAAADGKIIYNGTDFGGYSGNTFIKFGSSNSVYYNGTILREWQIGQSFNGNVNNFIEYMLFAPPTISLNFTPTTTVYEMGTSIPIIISGQTSNPGNASLSNGVLRNTTDGVSIGTFGSNTTYSYTITYAPTQSSSTGYWKSSYTFEVAQDWDSGSETGTITQVKTIMAVYPYLYGMSAIDYTASGNPYTDLTKLVQTEGDKTVTLNGDGEYIYFLFEDGYSDLTSIIDNNGFENLANFDKLTITITSSGLTNNWTKSYTMYKSITKKYGVVNWSWQFKN